MAEAVVLVIHHLPDDPPTGDMGRGVLVTWPDGHVRLAPARMLVTADWLLLDLPAWWCEFPTLPADPSERLTTEDVREAEQLIAWAAQKFEAEDAEPVSRDFYAPRYRALADRLRAALPKEAK